MSALREHVLQQTEERPCVSSFIAGQTLLIDELIPDGRYPQSSSFT